MHEVGAAKRAAAVGSSAALRMHGRPMQLHALVRGEKGAITRARRSPEPRLRLTRAEKGDDACVRGFDACSHTKSKVKRHLHFLHGCLAQQRCKNGRYIKND
jgi:hypothetical protein